MRQLLNSRQIRVLRQVAESALPDRPTLRNPGTSTRGSGGGIVAAAPVDTVNAHGRLEVIGNQSGAVREVAARLQLVNPYVWVFGANQGNLTDLTTIILGSRTFRVRAVMQRGEWGMVKRAICDEV